MRRKPPWHLPFVPCNQPLEPIVVASIKLLPDVSSGVPMSASAVVATARKSSRSTGLAFWMHQVLEECARAGVEFAPDLSLIHI